MQKLVFRNANGIELDLTSGDYGITEWEGFSAVDLNVQSQQVPFQDGSVYLDGLLGERELSVTVAMQDKNNLEKRYQLRRQMISVLNPKLGEGVLIYTNDYISKQIHCVAQMPVFENHNSNDSGTPKASCSFTACNPYWEDLEDTVVQANNGITTIINNGDIRTGVKIDVVPVNEIRKYEIKNNTTGKKILLDNEQRPFRINTNVGKKSVLSTNLKDNLVVSGIAIKSVVQLNEYFYGIRGNTICKSQDGLNWETVYTTSYSLNILKCFPSGLVAVGSNSTVIKSTNGEEWHRYKVTSDNYNLVDITFSSKLGLFVICGSMRLIATSDFTTSNIYFVGYDTNCVLWNAQTEKYYAGCSNNLLYSSENGTVWASEPSPYTGSTGASYLNFKRLLMLENKMLLTLNNSNAETETMYSTTDGSSWVTEAEVNSSVALNLFQVEDNLYWGNNGLLYVTRINSLSGWTEGSIEANGEITSICLINKTLFLYSNLIFVALENTNNFEKASIISNDTIYGICTNLQESVFVAYTGNCIYYSFNLEQWYIAIENLNISSQGVMKYINGYFYACGSTDMVLYKSQNGIEWETVEIDISDTDLRGLDYSEKLNLWIVIGTNKIFTSSDLETFTQSYTGTSTLINGCWAKNTEIFVIPDRSGGVILSSDGETWTRKIVSAGNSFLRAREIGSDVYLTSENYVFRSSDGGENWTNTGIVSIQDVCGNNTIILFIKYGTTNYNIYMFNKTLAKSYDLIKPINNAEYCGIWVETLSSFLTVGSNGQICRTQTEPNENIIQELSKDSDMSFCLEVGNNIIETSTLLGNSETTVSYRQKYIGV